MPATFVVGRDGRVALAMVEADYRRRLEPGHILDALALISSNISASLLQAVFKMPYRCRAPGVEQPLWSSAALKPSPSVIRASIPFVSHGRRPPT